MKLNLEAVRCSEQCDMAFWVAIDHVEVVRLVTSQDGNIAATRIAENPERPLNVCPFPINSDKGKPRLNEEAFDPATDATEFRSLFFW